MGNEKVPITKEYLIRLFKFLCCGSQDPVQLDRRKLAVETQFQRCVWELDSYLFGKVRIEKSDPCKITLYAAIKFMQKQSDVYVFDITEQEYEELKALYFGDFEEDTAYLEKMKECLSRHD